MLGREGANGRFVKAFFTVDHEMLAVVEEEVTHDAPKVVDEIGVIEVHAPTVGRGRETAEKEHAAVGRQEGGEGVRLDGQFVLRCECIGRSVGLPAFPIIPATSALCKWRYGWSFDEASALEAVRRCRKPMLFIHGGNDHFVPTAMVHPLYAAKPGIKALWIAPHSAHAMSYIDHPEEYERRVRQFLDHHAW